MYVRWTFMWYEVSMDISVLFYSFVKCSIWYWFYLCIILAIEMMEVKEINNVSWFQTYRAYMVFCNNGKINANKYMCIRSLSSELASIQNVIMDNSYDLWFNSFLLIRKSNRILPSRNLQFHFQIVQTFIQFPPPQLWYSLFHKQTFTEMLVQYLYYIASESRHVSGIFSIFIINSQPIIDLFLIKVDRNLDAWY